MQIRQSQHVVIAVVDDAGISPLLSLLNSTGAAAAAPFMSVTLGNEAGTRAEVSGYGRYLVLKHSGSGGVRHFVCGLVAWAGNAAAAAALTYVYEARTGRLEPARYRYTVDVRSIVSLKRQAGGEDGR